MNKGFILRNIYNRCRKEKLTHRDAEKIANETLERYCAGKLKNASEIFDWVKTEIARKIKNAK